MANKKFNFKTPVLDISGEPTSENGKEIQCSDILSEMIMTSRINEEDIVVKFFGWGLELKKTGVLTLDKVDEDKLRKWILSNPNITVLGKGRLSEVLDNAVK